MKTEVCRSYHLSLGDLREAVHHWLKTQKDCPVPEEADDLRFSFASAIPTEASAPALIALYYAEIDR